MFEASMRLTLFLFLVAVAMTAINLHRPARTSRWTLRAWAAAFVAFFATLAAMIWGA